MYVVRFSIRSRMALMNMLNSKVSGKRKNKDRREAAALLAKVSIPDEEMSRYQNFGMVNFSGLATAQDITVELSRTDLMILDSIVDSWDKFSPGDDVWLDPLMEQVESGLKVKEMTQ